MELLNDDCWHHVLSFLNAASLRNVAQTCRTLHYLTNHVRSGRGGRRREWLTCWKESLWRNLCHVDFDETARDAARAWIMAVGQKESMIPWKQLYR